MMNTLQEACTREIIELHGFFERWFNGTIPQTDDAFARFAAGMAESFAMRTPDGDELDHDSVIDRVRGAYRSARDSGPVRIWIEDIREVESDGDRAVIEYEEWQTEAPADAPRGRRSTATFHRDGRAPNGVVWIDLREEWLHR